MLKIILDSKLKTPLNANVLKNGNSIIFTSANNSSKTILLNKKGTRIIKIKKGKNGFLSWDVILKELYKMNISSVLIEGGAKVISSVLKAGIVDKLYLFLAPKFLGKGLSFTDGINLNSLDQAIKLKEYRVHQIGNDILIEGYLR